MPKRLGIYVIYDEQNVIDRADLYLAREIRSVVSRLIVCVNSNGRVDLCGLKEYTEEIIVRDNRGFDAGAVKEILCGYLRDGELQEYEELVVSNDSFFGPFIPMHSIFEAMNTRDCDYWGLSGYMGDESIFWRGVGSYFWVFRQPVTESRFLENYIGRYVDAETEDFLEVCGVYECRMNYELMKRFKPALFVDVGALNIFDAGDVAMMEYALPILKRKFFTEKRTSPTRRINALRFIADTGFDVSVVAEKLKRLYDIDVFDDGGVWVRPEIEEKEYEIPKMDVTYAQIENFLRIHQSVYIYGAGHFATFIWAIFAERYPSIKGFVVTRQTETATFHGYPVYTPAELPSPSAVLVALNRENSAEVKGNLRGKNCLFLHRL